MTALTLEELEAAARRHTVPWLGVELEDERWCVRCYTPDGEEHREWHVMRFPEEDGALAYARQVAGNGSYVGEAQEAWYTRKGRRTVCIFPES